MMRDAERLRHLEAAVDLFVGVIVAETVIVGLELDARAVELFADRGEMIKRGGQPPLPLLLAGLGASRGRLRPRLDVAGKELTFADADPGHGLDRLVERHGAEAVGLDADAHAADFGIDVGQRDRERQAGEGDFPEFSSRIHV